VRTRVGYAGGTKPNPTYHDLGDHSETLQIEFDPGLITYEKLLGLFWKAHDPAWPAQSRQYRAALFYHGEEQKRLALESRERQQARHGRAIRTDVFPFQEFYRAEDYHQKFYLRQDPGLMGEFRAIYPEARAFTDSTAAARVNGYLAGYGSQAALQHDLDLLGLSPNGRKGLLDSVSSR
jgi:peptide-methionine (S)-S-oxide reductase